MPFQKGYQNNMPSNPAPRLRQKDPGSSGLLKSGDYYATRTARLQASPSPTSVRMQPLAQFQNLEQQPKAAGIKLEQDNQPQSSSTP